MAALAPQFAALGLLPCQISDYPGDAVLLNAWLSPALSRGVGVLPLTNPQLRHEALSSSSPITHPLFLTFS